MAAHSDRSLQTRSPPGFRSRTIGCVPKGQGTTARIPTVERQMAHGHAHSGVQPQKSWGGSHITPSPLSHHIPSPPHMTDTTPSGRQPPTWSVMRTGRKPKRRSSHGALPPPHSKSSQTTPSQALTSSASAPTTPPPHTPPRTSVAPVGNPSDPWSTSSSTARDLSNHASHSPSSARRGIPSTPSSPTPAFSPPEEGLRRCASIAMCEVRNQNWQTHGSNGWD